MLNLRPRMSDGELKLGNIRETNVVDGNCIKLSLKEITHYRSLYL